MGANGFVFSVRSKSQTPIPNRIMASLLREPKREQSNEIIVIKDEEDEIPPVREKKKAKKPKRPRARFRPDPDLMRRLEAKLTPDAENRVINITLQMAGLENYLDKLFAVREQLLRGATSAAIFAHVDDLMTHWRHKNAILTNTESANEVVFEEEEEEEAEEEKD